MSVREKMPVVLLAGALAVIGAAGLAAAAKPTRGASTATAPAVTGIPPESGPPAGPAEVQKALTALGASLKDLTAARDGLAQQLDARSKADNAAEAPRDLVLRLDEGADREELHLVLRRRGGEWRSSHAVVPAWRQETMQEKYHHHHGTGSVPRDKFTHQADASGLQFAADALKGNVEATLRIDLLKEQREPPATTFSWWDHFMVVGYSKPWQQSFSLDARILPDAHEFSCVIEGGVNWGKARRPIFITFQVPSRPWTSPRVLAPTWNRAVHEADASGLRFSAGRLEGALAVTLNADLWVPQDRKPRLVKFAVDARLENGRLTGAYKATGEMGEYDGAIVGNGGTMVEGRYRAAGDLGDYQGKVRGRAITWPLNAGDLLPKTADLPKDPVAAVRAAVDQAGGLYQQCRALHLAMSRYPYPLALALEQTGQTLSPQWGPPACPTISAGGLQAGLAYVEGLKSSLAGVQKSPAGTCTFALGLPRPGDPQFGPFSDVAPLESAAGKPNQVAADADAKGPQRWQFVPEWRVLGPLPMTDELEMNLAEMPDLLPAAEAHYLPDAARFSALGMSVPNTDPMAWTPAATTSGRLLPPWSPKGHVFRMSKPSVWYAAAEVYSDKPRQLYLACSANDHAKVWVNDALVWVDAEKQWAYRSRDPAVFKVSLKQGVNRLLVRCRDDRNESWFRLHLCTGGAPRPAAEAEKQIALDRQAEAKAQAGNVVGHLGDGASQYPSADPPLAWDIDKGVNVAWRADLPGGPGQPIVAAGRVLTASEPHTLHCLDEKTGKVLWSKESSLFEMVDKALKDAWEAAPAGKEKDSALSKAVGANPGRSTTPVSDGKCVWVHHGTGLAACYDLEGSRKWMVRTHMTGASLLLVDGVLIVEGAVTGEWSLDGEAKEPAKGKAKAKGAESHGLVAIDASSGQRRWAQEVRGGFRGGSIKLLRLAGAAGKLDALVTFSDEVFDARTGRKLLNDLDIDHPFSIPTDSYSIIPHEGSLFYTCMAEKIAADYWLEGADRFSYRTRWVNHYEVSGFFNVGATAMAHDNLLYTWAPVLERGPHCPSALVEVNAFDIATGRPVARIKPAMRNAVSHGIVPAAAGGYLYFSDAGGGTHGGLQGNGQISVVRAGPRPYVVCRNLVDQGTSSPPVFSGQRMFLRSPRALTCIAVTTPEGRRYQDERLAQVLFEDVGRQPPAGELLTVQPPKDEPLPPVNVPVTKLVPGDGITQWLTAGPFPAAAPEEADALAASLRAQPGSSAALGGAARQFAPIDEKLVRIFGPTYHEHFNTQGRGMRYPSWVRKIDPRGFLDGKTDQAGLFYTVLDNHRQRIVGLSLEDPGVDVWLGGQRIRRGQTVRLMPGLYPVLVCVGPEFFVRQAPTGPLNVQKAMEAGAVRDIKWPATWQVFGPIAPDAGLLPQDELQSVPDKVTIGNNVYPARQVAADKLTLDLTGQLAPRSVDTNRPEKIAEGHGAYCFAEIDVPADGTLVANATADWWMAWYLDGKLIYSTMDSGNRAPPDRITGHTFSAKVGKGRHVLAALVQSGSQGWSVASVGGLTVKTVEELSKDFADPAGVKARDPDFLLQVSFAEFSDPAQLHRLWLERLDARREVLERLAKALSGADHGSRARTYLEMLGKGPQRWGRPGAGPVPD